MTATGHAIIGTVIAAKLGNPYFAIPIAIFSHIAADLFPHWDSGTHGHSKSKVRFFFEAAADVLIGLLAMHLLIQFFFPQTNLIYAFIIVIFAQLFDWITMPYIFGMKIFPFNYFYKFSSATNSKLDKPWGIINQVAILALIVFLATKIP